MRQDELYHYGVKGMKWKDHKYKAVKNGQYIYDVAKYNLTGQGKEDIHNYNMEMLKSATQSSNAKTIYYNSPRVQGKRAGFAADSALHRAKAEAYMARYNKYSLAGIASTKAKKGKERTSAALEKLRLKAKNKVIERKTKNGLQVKPPVTTTAKRKYNIAKDKVTTTAKNVKQAARTVKGIYDYNHDRLTPASYDLVTGGSSNSSSGVKRRKKKK